MRRQLVIVLFFFCLIGCTGCSEKMDGFLKLEGERIEVMGDREKLEETRSENTLSEKTLTENTLSENEPSEKTLSENTLSNGSLMNEKLEDKESVEDEFVVLVDGEEKVTAAAEFICDKMNAVYYNMSIENKARIEESVKKAEFVLLGTESNLLEFEFSTRNCIEEDLLNGKKVALFLLDLEEERERFTESFCAWYPGVVMLPELTLSTEIEEEQELGRLNGWLTTLYTIEDTKQE